ncbi:hypothetical protein Tco_1044508 [Tanacetum coccineum]|uniref:Gag-Pol polyprotein n=1 Tax=Tanacetum coccineum TaxID=301880 RepID=A0ABQ5GSN5_9ASTR
MLNRGMNMGQDRQMQIVGGNGGNQFRQYVGQNVGNQNGWQIGVQNIGNGNVRPRRRDAAYLQIQLLIAQKEEAGIQLQAKEFDLMAAAADLDEIEEVNANCILMANLQQASTSDELLDKQIQLENKIKELDNILVKTGQSIQTMHMLSPKPDSFYHTEQKMALGYQNPFYLKQAQRKHQCLYDGKVLLEKHDPPVVHDSEETLQLAQEKAAKFVRDFKSLAKEADESLAKHKTLELEIERLLRAVVSQDIMSIVQNPSVVDSSNLQTELDRTKERLENCIIKKENEYAKLWNDWYKKCEECKYDKISYDKAYNDMQQKIERLQAQLGDQKGKSQDTPCVSTPRSYLRAQLFDKVSDQVDTTKGTSTNTKFANQKVDETNDLSNPVTSNSVPTPQESKSVKHDNVIAPGMFRINPFKPSREEKYVPNKVRTSVRTTPITVSQPHVVTKKDVNSDSNGLSSTGVDNTAKTRRPQPRSNTKNDRVPSASKSSCNN